MRKKTTQPETPETQPAAKPRARKQPETEVPAPTKAAQAEAKPAPKRTAKAEPAAAKPSRAKRAVEPAVEAEAPAKPSRSKKAAEPAVAPAEEKKPAARTKKAEPEAAKPAPKGAPSAKQPSAKKGEAESFGDLAPVFRAKPKGPADLRGVEAQGEKNRAKPGALKSLAELVEEDKKNPKPRAKKEAPKPAEPAPEPQAQPVAATRPSNPNKGNPNARRGQERKPRHAESDAPAELSSLEGLETEQMDDWLVYWRPAAERPAQDESTAGEKRGRRRRRRGGRDRDDEQAAAPSKPRVEIEADPLDMDELAEAGLELAFRSREEGSAPAEKPAKGRGRERTERKPKPAAEKLPEPEPEPVPVVPVRPRIPIPQDAPQIVVRKGVATLVRDGKVLPPLAFFASMPDERRVQTVLSEIKRASEAGVHVHSHLVEFEVDPASLESSVKFAAYALAKTLEVDPQAQVIFRLVFVAPRGWESSYPNAKFLTEAGRLADPSVSDDEFWGVARELLGQFIKQIRELEQAKSVLGVHLDRGEWFYQQGMGYDTSKAASQGFRDWLRTRYVNDVVALRAAWFDGSVEFNSVAIPAYEQSDEGPNFMRTSRKDRRWVDYHLFMSDAIVARIADLAYAAKESSEGYFLVGVSYGYTFEWSHPASGHLSLGKLLRTREIDFIAGPPSYRSREPGGAAPFPCPIDSLSLNGKLYLSEEDFKTAIGDTKEPDDYNPVMRTPQALENAHWRGVGAALAHGSGAFWMDLWGNGWLNTSTIWDRGAQAKDALIWRMGAEQTEPDVAVFIDERALAYLVDQKSFALLVQDVRESVLRSGLSAGFYLLSDLAHREAFPECKLYIFLNAWDLRPEHRFAIKNRLQRDGKVLYWLYGAGMFDNGREALERAREVTGIAIKPQPFHSKTGTTLLNRRHVLSEAFSGEPLIGGAHVDPSYFAIPERAVVLGEYSQSGLPSIVVRDFNEDPDPTKHWKSVFSGEPVVTPALLRGLAQMAGAHIWNYQDDVVHVRPPFLAVHCSGTGPRAIILPKDWEAYNLSQRRWETEESNAVRFQGLDGATHLFIVGRHEEVEAVLQSNPAELLNYDGPYTFEEDAVQHDAMLFDVPIMRLDEIIDGISDDAADDWLFKPSMIETEDAEDAAPTEERVGSRRRRRSRNRGRGDRGERGGEEVRVDSDFEMNVMFRKRE